MKPFEINLGTNIYFGKNILEDAIEKIKGILPRNILIVTTGRSLYRNGYIARVEQALKNSGKVEQVVIYDEVSPNPRLSEANEAILLGKSHHVQMVIGVGGGSAIDTAKAAAVGIPLDESLDDYFLKGKEPGDMTLPIIAIPTTAGTGSELSKGAILSSPEHYLKSGIRGDRILPRAAIVDSSFTYSVPLEKTMEMGFDVLAHGIESYVAVKANVFSEMISEKLIRTAADALPRLKADLNDHDARDKMSFVSMIAGFNLASVGTCLPHRMQYVIGARTDTSHAAGLIALYPAWIGYEFGVNQDKINKIYAWMGLPDISSGEQARRRMSEFLGHLGLEESLCSLGIDEGEADLLASEVKGNIANDPLAGTEEIINMIFKESFGGI